MQGSFSTIFVFCVLQVINCNDVRQQRETFEEQLNQKLARSYSGLASIRNAAVWNKFLPRLKPKYRDVVDRINEQMLDELRTHYDNLKKTSLETGIFPAMDENLLELKAFEIQPKYLDKMANSFLYAIRSMPDITPEAKAVISNKLTIVLKNTKALLIEPVINEIKSQINEWRAVDVLSLVSGDKYIPSSPEQEKVMSDIKKRLNSVYLNYSSLTDSHFQALTNALKPYGYLFMDVSPRPNDV